MHKLKLVNPKKRLIGIQEINILIISMRIILGDSYIQQILYRLKKGTYKNFFKFFLQAYPHVT